MEEVAVAPFTVSVPDDHWHSALLIRAFEERLLKLFSEARIFGTVHTCIGQEFTGIAIASALKDGDLIYSNHRCHGHYLARTGDANGLMAEIMGRQAGICGGRGGSQHICAHGVFSNGIQGGIVAVSSGLALAQKQKQTGSIAVVFVGDGTLGEGIIYECMNIASKWGLPLLVAMENNLYAQSTSQTETLAGEILARPAAFGIKTYHSEIWDLGHLFSEASAAVNYVRDNCAPAFIRIDTYRLMAHSKGDDDRNKDEVNRYWANDPITRLQEHEPERYARLKERVDARISDAVTFGDGSPYTAPPVFSAARREGLSWSPNVFPETEERMVARIHKALSEAMESDERVFLIGEDIEGPYGGAFKVTKDLSQKFPGRVRNTPISESAIVGISNGLALGGMIPICEIMFGDFMTLAMDQILNHAAKFRYMYNEQFKAPLIVRTPMGGKRGYGATHSQSLEKHFLGIPDTTVIALHHRLDPYLIYRDLIRDVDSPTIVIENKMLYGQYVSGTAPEGFAWENSGARFPTTRLSSGDKPDLTIVCYGGVLYDVEKVVDQLIDEHELVPEIVVPMSLYPLDIAPILDSVGRSGRLLTVEEGQGFCGFGSEVLAKLQEAAPGILKSCARHSAMPAAIPSAKPAEDLMLPGPASILAAALEVVNRG